jgi:hypothetical protein
MKLNGLHLLLNLIVYVFEIVHTHNLVPVSVNKICPVINVIHLGHVRTSHQSLCSLQLSVEQDIATAGPRGYFPEFVLLLSAPLTVSDEYVVTGSRIHRGTEPRTT